jgi:inositol phosphorylceramide mannosyltransferase catalytic subunit
MIPKIFHHVWVGPSPLPERELKFINTFKHYHPDWEFMLWRDNNINNLSLPKNCEDAYNLTINWKKDIPCYACQADVVRQVAVLRYGGIYVDTDVECFKSIDTLIENKTDFIGIKPHRGNLITNAFFGASKDHKLIKCIVDDIKPRPPGHNGPSFLTNHLYSFLSIPNPSINERVKVETLNNINIKILSDEIWSHKNADAFMKHYFEASWRKS